MAYIIGTKRPETQGEPQQLVSGTPSMLGQGSTGVQAQTGQAAPSTFTNLQRYIEANQGNVGGLAQAIESKKSSIENPFQQAKTEAEIAKQNVQSAIEKRGQAESSLKSAVEKARTAPATLGAEEVKNIRNLATTFNYDPSQVLTPLTTAVAGLGGKAQTSAAGLENLATREGQRQALIEARQAPRSSLGGLELDTFLLGASPEAQSRVQALNLPTRANELRQALTPFQENITEFQKTQGLTSADLQKQLSSGLQNFQKTLEARPNVRIQTPSNMFNLDIESINKEITQKPNLYNINTESGRQNIRDLANKNIITQEKRLSPEQVASYKAYSELAGMSPDQFLKSSGLSDEEIQSNLNQYIESLTPPPQKPIEIVGEIGQPGLITTAQLAPPANATTTTAPPAPLSLDEMFFNLQNIANSIGLNR
jgi:hypothetical protein